MVHDFDIELGASSSGHEATLDSMFECCNQLKELAHSSEDSYTSELQAILESHIENGYGVFSVNKYDDLADPIEDDAYAFSLLKAAVERRKEEGVSVSPTHAIISSCGNVLAINAEDLSLCTLVRHVG
jgi:hypothetical protein